MKNNTLTLPIVNIKIVERLQRFTADWEQHKINIKALEKVDYFKQSEQADAYLNRIKWVNYTFDNVIASNIEVPAYTPLTPLYAAFVDADTILTKVYVAYSMRVLTTNEIHKVRGDLVFKPLDSMLGRIKITNKVNKERENA